jgi:hypothetical protein
MSFITSNTIKLKQELKRAPSSLLLKDLIFLIFLLKLILCSKLFRDPARLRFLKDKEHD